MGKSLQLSFTMALALGTVAACGASDDPSSADGATSTADFCVLLTSSFDDANLEDAEGMAALRMLAEQAPESLRADFDVFVDAIEKLDGLDENDSDAFETAFAVMLDPKMIEASTNLEEFGTTECGMDPALFDADSGDFDDDGPPNSSFGYDEAPDPNVISLNGIQTYLDEQFGDTSWRSEITGYTLIGSRKLEVSGSDISADAVEICTAVLGYAVPIDAEATVKVTDDSGSFVHASNINDDGSCSSG